MRDVGRITEARECPYPPGDGKVKLITTEWLEDHLRDRDMTIIDTQPNVHDYLMEHIPGAVYLNEGVLRAPAKGMPTSYAPIEALQQIFRRVGLLPDHPVVVYTGKGAVKGWGDGLGQTMMAYSLAKFGHDTVYLLDGGLDKWKQEGRPLSQEFPDISPSGFTVDLRGEYAIGYDEFRDVKDREDVILLDARPPHLYEGWGAWRKPGHIPGAINLPWADLMHADNPAYFKTDDELISILEEHNIDRNKTIICSCGTGREATNEFILFKWLFRYPEVRIYEGSFTEWTAHPENRTVEGKEPWMREAVPPPAGPV
ncbi:MAG: sulfurtransferase [Methanomicrobiaceae archaeon]|uniref:Thiosulfate sulfurtransferase, rhodanese n=1 Tax=hydrocarbon metagenome TaxID=938273 RepID=A0A0W8FES3_9ZZZZ|nr:sulfurtransferase [Methanomicrobiaceae archaeon]